MQAKHLRKLKTLAWICLFTCLAGVFYQLIHEGCLDHNSVIVGFPLGLGFGILELYLFPKAQIWVGQWSFTKMLVVKTLLYTALIYKVTLALMLVAGWVEGRKLSELASFLGSTRQLILVLYTLIIYNLLIFILQVNHLLGEGNLWKFILGKYHKPREEERIFMFLDMKSSTTIAEQLGHVRFYSLLNELFHEISQPVLETKAQIYQYVGDEVVLTWEMKQGLEKANCLKMFFLFQQSLLGNKEKYLKKYGLQPEFKAGLHCGKVISAQIGDLKREIVYNGDVLKTSQNSTCLQSLWVRLPGVGYSPQPAERDK
ncbi:adenylate/guanylate cyclase domain-containing protein [Rhodocytophaga aerolata]|uniref:Adenylate/guanylate cyclase domain-containing protein n=1 Tax=Rhodocytophaga aerolata TaxID=455078 RepID=A0ABT8RIQ5_9BACT|nr:adenylate/guanylate cyclase domain-containing protein [Rhodocytophaga aerolata]MDO1451979.1 adenylate/guanylate cyclase domain-containing protein [Rhodocytophaga aerolata]